MGKLKHANPLLDYRIGTPGRFFEPSILNVRDPMRQPKTVLPAYGPPTDVDLSDWL
jgi:hypothetical protein